MVINITEHYYTITYIIKNPLLFQDAKNFQVFIFLFRFFPGVSDVIQNNTSPLL